MVTISLVGGALEFRAPYDQQMVAELKLRIPASDRRWDGTRKSWLVSPNQGHMLQEISKRYFGMQPALPAMPTAAASVQTRLLEVRYLGRTKPHGSEETAYAWVDNGWRAVFTKAALQEWFGVSSRPGESATLYQVLGLKQDAAPADIKGAWKRLVRQWHPDTCREPDAAGQFRAIKDAYDVLSNEGNRARYDAGLKLQALVGPMGDGVAVAGVLEWVPPLRCGWIMGEGTDKVSGFYVTRIVGWQDITRADGCTLVSSWPNGAEKPVEVWI